MIKSRKFDLFYDPKLQLGYLVLPKNVQMDLTRLRMENFSVLLQLLKFWENLETLTKFADSQMIMKVRGFRGLPGP